MGGGFHRAALVVAALALVGAGCGRFGYGSLSAVAGDGGVGDLDGGVLELGDGGTLPGASDDPTVTGGNVIFVSSKDIVPGMLGSVEAADAFCTQLAKNAGLLGTYVALLSSTTSDFIDRVGDARGWVRVDGYPVADTIEDLLTYPYYVVNLDENGVRVNAQVLTATGADGRVFTANTLGGFVGTCGDFTDPTPNTYVYGGNSARTDKEFLLDLVYLVTCNHPARLYCLGIDENAPLDLVPATGRFAFMTETRWAPHGIDKADALCQSEADQAGLPGTYRALLATLTTSAVSRFDLGGPPWIATNGARLGKTTDAFMKGELDATPRFTASGAIAYSLVWTGYAGPGETAVDIGSLACEPNWKSSPDLLGGVGDPNSATPTFFGAESTASCQNGEQALICLQE